jgi:hypothetical protein
LASALPAENDDMIVLSPPGGQGLADKSRAARYDDLFVSHDREW